MEMMIRWIVSIIYGDDVLWLVYVLFWVTPESSFKEELPLVENNQQLYLSALFSYHSTFLLYGSNLRFLFIFYLFKEHVIYFIHLQLGLHDSFLLWVHVRVDAYFLRCSAPPILGLGLIFRACCYFFKGIWLFFLGYVVSFTKGKVT